MSRTHSWVALMELFVQSAMEGQYREFQQGHASWVVATFFIKQACAEYASSASFGPSSFASSATGCGYACRNASSSSTLEETVRSSLSSSRRAPGLLMRVVVAASVGESSELSEREIIAHD